jgi:hypothetical protein
MSSGNGASANAAGGTSSPGKQGGSSKPGVKITSKPPKKQKTGQRDRLIEIAVTSGIAYWHDADGNAFATFSRNGRVERYRVRSAAFKRLLRRLYGDAHPNRTATKKAGGIVPGGVSDTAMNEALPTLEAHAQNGPTREPCVRVHRDGAGTVWIDLGDETWRCIAIGPNGWRIVNEADVPLIRPNGMRALPVPTPDRDALAKLRALVNLNPGEKASPAALSCAESSFKLAVAFKLSVFWPRGPYPILSVNGEHGSAKSTACRIIRMITDPNRAPLRSVPRNPDDLFVTAQHSRLLSLDNVSHLTPEPADVLCGIATGSGKGARQLYTDGEEAILGASNPIIVNGIEGLLTRADLADRCLSIMLTMISDEDRRDEAEMEAAITDAAPGILALLLDAIAEAMRALPTLKLPRLPRMADFTRLACAAAPAFGWTVDEVFKAIIENRDITTEAVLAADVVATAALAFLQQRQAAQNSDGGTYLWIGSATELLGILKGFVPEETIRSPAWPKQPNHLSGRLKRAAPGLRKRGFVIMTGKGTDKNRKIAFKAIGNAGTVEDQDNSSSPPLPSSFDSIINGLEGTMVGTMAPAASSPPTGSEQKGSGLGTMGHASSSPSSSPEDDAYISDNIGEYRYGDDGDDGDDEVLLPPNIEIPSAPAYSVDAAPEFGDDEGEI